MHFSLHVAFTTIIGIALVVFVFWGIGSLNIIVLGMSDMLICSLMLALSTLLLWLECVFVKRLYDVFSTDDNINNYSSMVFRLVVSFAKSIQNQNPLLYKVVDFVIPDEDLYSKALMDVLVRHNSPRLVEYI